MKSLSSRSSYSTKRKVTIAAVIVVVLLSIASGLYLYFAGQQNADKNKTDSTNTSAKKDAASQDEDNKSSSSNNGDSGLPEDSTAITSEQVPVSQNLSVSLTNASQSAGLISATAQTSGSGTCVFLYQPADQGKPVTRQVNVENDTCSVSISQNEFAYLGQWKLTVTYYSNNAKAEASQNVTIN